MRRWPEQYGFAFLVVVAIGCGSFLAGSVEVPEPVPTFALQAAEIYRLEIGVAFFAVFYVATMTLLLALGGRGYAEVGTRGLKVAQVVMKSNATLRQQGRVDRETQAMICEVDADLKAIAKELNSYQQRLEILETRR
jgi:hypothetical protein